MKRGLLRQFALVFFLFSLVTLLNSGIAAYHHQTRSHQAREEQLLQEIAYEEALGRLSWQMQEGEIAFGIAVADVNFLKQMNDTYGHEAGNRAIQSCCALLCRVFARSPVFRIGGDEFAVLLEGEAYRDIAALAQAFLRAQEDQPGEPGQNLSAAIGYALYDSARDDCVENVFSRADKAMYRNKREMKALR